MLYKVIQTKLLQEPVLAQCVALTSDWTFSKVVPTDPLGVVMLFAVSQGSQPTFGNLRKRSFFITHFFVTETGFQLEMGNSFFMSDSI